MIIKMKKYIKLLLISMIVVGPLNVVAEDKKEVEISVLSETAVLVDADNKSIIFGDGADQKMYPASITKIMTVLLALENLELDQEITVSQTALDAVEEGSSHIALSVGEKLLVEDLCYATLLASANDGANVLGEAVSGTMASFGEKMTARAKEIGARNTNFTNPSGLPDENHYTTAYDMAIITAEAIKNEDFLKMFSTISYTARPTNLLEEARVFANGNNLIKKGAENYEFAIGGKTGWTTPAGYTLVTYAKNDNLNLIAVTMKSESRDISYKDTENLFEYAFSQFHKVFIPKEKVEVVVGVIYSGNYLHAKYETTNKNDFGLLLPKGITEADVRLETVVENEGDVNNISAKVNVYVNEKLVGELPLNIEKEVYDISFKNTTLKEIIKYFNYMCIAILGLSVLALLSKVLRKIIKTS